MADSTPGLRKLRIRIRSEPTLAASRRKSFQWDNLILWALRALAGYALSRASDGLGEAFYEQLRVMRTGERGTGVILSVLRKRAPYR